MPGDFLLKPPQRARFALQKGRNADGAPALPSRTAPTKFAQVATQLHASAAKLNFAQFGSQEGCPKHSFE
eukprot:15055222-Alexandrium_andersonii.AAC.1